MPNEEAIKQIAKVRRLTPAQMRRLWAKASTAKRFIIGTISALRLVAARQVALEELLTAKGVLTEEDGEKIDFLMSEINEDTQRNPFGISSEDWKEIEDAMVRDINKKIEREVRETEGITKTVGAD